MYRLFQGDSLRLLGRLPLNSFDALITDPPYASGDPRQSSAEKYVTSGCKRAYTRHSFYGENLSQRSWMHWCADWLELCIQVVRPGGVAAVFCDWRQLPALMDTLDRVFRGVMPWDKGNARPQPHQPKQVCEFIVWGSNGKLDTKRGCRLYGRHLPGKTSFLRKAGPPDGKEPGHDAPAGSSLCPWRNHSGPLCGICHYLGCRHFGRISGDRD